MELHVDRCKKRQTGHRLMCACHNIILTESTGICKHHIGLDNVLCKQSTESFNQNYFNQNDKKSVHLNMPSAT